MGDRIDIDAIRQRHALAERHGAAYGAHHDRRRLLAEVDRMRNALDAIRGICMVASESYPTAIAGIVGVAQDALGETDG